MSLPENKTRPLVRFQPSIPIREWKDPRNDETMNRFGGPSMYSNYPQRQAAASQTTESTHRKRDKGEHYKQILDCGAMTIQFFRPRPLR
jgi:hypothetical protein